MKDTETKLKDFLRENMNNGTGALWQHSEMIIEQCFDDDFITYSYTNKGTIYNKITGEKICRVKTWRENADGNVWVFLEDITLLYDNSSLREVLDNENYELMKEDYISVYGEEECKKLMKENFK